MTQRFYKSSVIMMLLISLLLVSGCATCAGTAIRQIPKPIYPTDQEDAILAEQVPDFYLKFLNQQFDIEEALRGS